MKRPQNFIMMIDTNPIIDCVGGEISMWTSPHIPDFVWVKRGRGVVGTESGMAIQLDFENEFWELKVVEPAAPRNTLIRHVKGDLLKEDVKTFDDFRNWITKLWNKYMEE